MSICDLKSYEIVQSRDLSDLSSKGTLLRHKKSGARVLLMENDDENKVFAVRQYRSTSYYGAFCIVRIKRVSGKRSFCRACKRIA